MTWLTDILGALGGSISAVVNGWQQRATARVEAEVKTAAARAEAEATILVAQATAAQRLAENDQANAQAWDMLVAGQMDRTWKDEFYVLIFAAPLVLAFCGEWGAGVVERGFTALDDMPSWFFYSIGTMIAATFGMRRLVDFFSSVRGR